MYLHVRHSGTLFLRSSYHHLFKNIAQLQKIFGLCGLKGHIVEIRVGVTLEDDGRTMECEEEGPEFWKQNSQNGTGPILDAHL